MKTIIHKYNGTILSKKQSKQLRKEDIDKSKVGKRYVGGCFMFGMFHRKFNQRETFLKLKGAA
jgi:hypothetical protein